MEAAKQLLFKCRLGEIFTRTAYPWREISMQVNPLGRQRECLLEPPHQLAQGFHLFFGEGTAVSLSHEADADGVIVVIIAIWTRYMHTGELFIPTISHMNHPIPQSGSIPDNKVVAQPLIPIITVHSVDGCGITPGQSQIVNHDIFPTGMIQRGLNARHWVCSRMLIEMREICGEKTRTGRLVSQCQHPRHHGHHAEKTNPHDVRSFCGSVALC